MNGPAPDCEYTSLSSGKAQCDFESKGGAAAPPLLPTTDPAAHNQSSLGPVAAAADFGSDGYADSSSIPGRSLASVLLGEGFLKRSFTGDTAARETQQAMLDAMRRAHVTSEDGNGGHCAHVGDWANGEIAGSGKEAREKGWGLIKQSVMKGDRRVKVRPR